MKVGRLASWGLPFDTIVFLTCLSGRLITHTPTARERREGQLPYAVVEVPTAGLPPRPWPPHLYMGITRRFTTDVVVSRPGSPSYYGDPVEDVINWLKEAVYNVSRRGAEADAREVAFVEQAGAAVLEPLDTDLQGVALRLDDWLDDAYRTPDPVFELARILQNLHA